MKNRTHPLMKLLLVEIALQSPGHRFAARIEEVQDRSRGPPLGIHAEKRMPERTHRHGTWLAVKLRQRLVRLVEALQRGRKQIGHLNLDSAVGSGVEFISNRSGGDHGPRTLIEDERLDGSSAGVKADDEGRIHQSLCYRTTGTYLPRRNGMSSMTRITTIVSSSKKLRVSRNSFTIK